ncbi:MULTISPECIES: hypothetical protein [Corallococcus]|nr:MULTISPECIES: hypothetical protein [Corallococcus]NPD26769.1 hypothetical protein [Corallococcus exiguus]
MSDTPSSSSLRTRLLLLLLSVCGVALPSLAVTIPPLCDLPQHLGQVRLLLEALHDPSGAYRIQPLTPYWGSNVVLLPLWLTLPVRWLGSASVLALGALFAAAVHWLAWRRNHSPEAAVLGSLFFFSQVLYWGFTPLLAGWPVYVVWLHFIQSPRATTPRGVLPFLLGAALLYWFHALWFAMGMFTLALNWARTRPGWKTVLLQGSAVTPVGLFALWWFSQLSKRGFTSPIFYERDFWVRISPVRFVSAAFGGMRDSVEGPVFILIVLWMGLGLWQHRKELRRLVDWALVVPGLFMLALSLVLPDLAQNTILMAERWVPFAMALLVLAVPAPRLPVQALRAWSAAAMLLLTGFTTLVWRAFEEQDLSGLEAAVDAVPEGARVLGLDYLRGSRIIEGRPFLQTFAWTYVWRGASNNFSFSWFAPSPVVLRRLRAPPWTQGLEWNARAVRPERDFRSFEYALVGLPDGDHEGLPQHLPLEPVTHEGRWRLYRTALPAPPPAPAQVAPTPKP